MYRPTSMKHRFPALMLLEVNPPATQGLQVWGCWSQNLGLVFFIWLGCKTECGWVSPAGVAFSGVSFVVLKLVQTYASICRIASLRFLPLINFLRPPTDTELILYRWYCIVLYILDVFLFLPLQQEIIEMRPPAARAGGSDQQEQKNLSPNS